MAALRDRVAAAAGKAFARQQATTGPVQRAVLRRTTEGVYDPDTQTGTSTVTDWPCSVLRRPRTRFTSLSALAAAGLAIESGARDYLVEGLPVGVEPKRADVLLIEDPTGSIAFAFSWNEQTVAVAQRFEVTLADEESAGMGVLYSVLVQ